MAISPPEIVRTVYSTHAQFLLGTLLVIFVAEAILLGVLRLVQWLAGQQLSKPHLAHCAQAVIYALKQG